MVNFAELKAKAEKAKDVSVNKMANTRDRFTSVPSSKVNWDPNWKRAPPPPPARPGSGPPPPPARSRPDVVASPPSRPDEPALSSYTPRPPPTRAASGYPSAHRETPADAATKIDWTNLSAEDKEAFFGWLDEFFSRYLGIEVGAGARPASITQLRRRVEHTRPPPTVNMSTRPRV